LHRSGFVAAVHHAIGALLVIAGAVRIPVRLFHQLAKAARIAFAEQVAGTLPSENVARRVAPRSAPVLAVAGEEVEKQIRLTERPRARTATAAEDVAKELLRALAGEKVRLVWRALVRVPGRYGNAVDAESARRVKESRDALRIGVVEKGAIDVHA